MFQLILRGLDAICWGQNLNEIKLEVSKDFGCMGKRAATKPTSTPLFWGAFSYKSSQKGSTQNKCKTIIFFNHFYHKHCRIISIIQE